MKKCVIIYNPASGKKNKQKDNIQIFYDILIVAVKFYGG